LLLPFAIKRVDPPLERVVPNGAKRR